MVIGRVNIHTSNYDHFDKVWLLFLLSALNIIDKFNMYFQTIGTATINRLHSESKRLFKSVLFVLDKQTFSYLTRLTHLDYSNCRYQLPNDEVFVNDDTTATLLK